MERTCQQTDLEDKGRPSCGNVEGPKIFFASERGTYCQNFVKKEKISMKCHKEVAYFVWAECQEMTLYLAISQRYAVKV
jgi:hypothetical protein